VGEILYAEVGMDQKKICATDPHQTCVQISW